MRIFTISDLHLGFAVNKPMDIFGSIWRDHHEKIRNNWNSTVGNSDIVLIPGDISWAMNLKQALPDLEFLDSLPGKKYISRGNHDYWWSSYNKVSEFVGPSITVLQRNAVDCGDFVLAASKGWNSPVWDGFKPSEDMKLYERELGRMKIALDMAVLLRKTGKKLVYMMHFPPIVDGRPSGFAEQLADAEVDLCLYGHLHGDWSESVNTKYLGVQYRIASADYLNFIPMDITSEVLN